MATNMQCPECGHEFEIEDTQQAKEKQAEALEAQKTQLKAKYDKEKDAEVEKQVKEKQAEALESQKTQLKVEYEKEKDAEVEKQVKEKQAIWKKNASQETQEYANKMVDKKIQPYIDKAEEDKTQIERLTTAITKLEQKSTRSQMPEIKGESAERRLKAQLIDRFENKEDRDKGDRIEDIPKGQLGADFKHYVKHNQQEIGMILIERKSTKIFQQGWIKKLKKDMEKSEANIGVIVTDNMLKKYKDVGFYRETSNIFVLKAVGAIDNIALLRELMIVTRDQEGYKKLSQDKKVVFRVFEYVGKGKGKEFLQEIRNTILERIILKNDRDIEHKKWMKKEEKNIFNQAETFRKLIKGFNDASQDKLNLIDAKILITDQTDD